MQARIEAFAKICIRDFSCISSAEVEIADNTIIIGPQASGKSVISKLSYFFLGLPRQALNSARLENTFHEFKEQVIAQFKRLFPIEAWGGLQFNLTFSSGELQFNLRRKGRYSGKVSNDCVIDLGSNFEAAFDAARSIAERAAELEADNRDLAVISSNYEASAAPFRELVSQNWISSLRFVPAGRSFFTSMGKAVTIFELLDPITTEFGKFFIPLRERRATSFVRSRATHRLSSGEMRSLLGGLLKVDQEKEFLVSEDGRKVPVIAMSSGQQEVFPLLLTLENISSLQGLSITFIEEPEAHLFPAAQSKLLELIIRVRNSALGDTRRLMFITTHSPYVLAKYNNLMKADQEGRGRGVDRAAAIERILDREVWVPSSGVRAYAIANGSVRSIIDEEGLIDTDYLDEVSAATSEEWMQLVIAGND